MCLPSEATSSSCCRTSASATRHWVCARTLARPPLCIGVLPAAPLLLNVLWAVCMSHASGPLRTLHGGVHLGRQRYDPQARGHYSNPGGRGKGGGASAAREHALLTPIRDTPPNAHPLCLGYRGMHRSLPVLTPPSSPSFCWRITSSGRARCSSSTLSPCLMKRRASGKPPSRACTQPWCKRYGWGAGGGGGGRPHTPRAPSPALNPTLL